MKRSVLLFLALIALPATAYADAWLLSLPRVIQERSNWCWAGSSEAVIRYYGGTVDKQCDLAEYARAHKKGGTDLGDVNCCEKSTACNLANGMDVITALINQWVPMKPANSFIYGQPSKDKIIDSVSNSEPIVFRFAWLYNDGTETGSAHFLVLHGYDSDNEIVSYMGPGRSEGFEVIDFSQFHLNNAHKLTHYIAMNRGPVCNCQTDDPCCDGCRSFWDDYVCGTTSGSCYSAGKCQNGQCTGRVRNDTVCATDNPCKTNARCDEVSGKCVADNLPNGTECTAIDKCADTAKCIHGKCEAMTFNKCQNDDTCRNNSKCNGNTGECIFTMLPNGTTCDDHNACTKNDKCQSGTCIGNVAVECPEKQCNSAGSCDPANGECHYDPLPDGSACSDDNPCTTEECRGGECVTINPSCDDNNPCTEDKCTATGCSNKPLPDGNICFTEKCGQQFCQNGLCIFTEGANNTCNDNNPCTRDLCNEENGCYHEMAANGTKCGYNGTCSAGECQQKSAAGKGCQNTKADWPATILIMLSLAYLYRREHQ